MQTINILLADDDPGHQYLFGRVIADSHANARLAFATSLGEFKRQTSEQEFDCAVLDFNISACCHANDLIDHLRTVQPDCPVIVISGSDDQQVAVESFRCGGADFVHKDIAVKPGVLWSRIMRAVRRRKRSLAERRIHQRRERRLRRMAETDALTGLANRRAVDSLFGDDGRHTLDRRGESSVIMVDIDHFKLINDEYGHFAGDRILKEVGALMRRFAAIQDVVARWGGEEFLLIRPRTPLVEAVRWSDELRSEIERTIRCGGDADRKVTASFGVYAVESAELGVVSIERADEALYQAKRRGRNRICLWELCEFESAIPEESGLTPEMRLDRSLKRLLPHLGPTQRQHMTEHSASVSRAAIQLGERAAMERRALDELRIAGLCHDIGKIAVPESVLAKPGPLDESERFLVDKHTDDGAFLSQRLGAGDGVAEIIRNSHVRFDNTNEKPGTAALTLSVADAFVAMTSIRSYHRPYSRDEALEELRRERGRQFDPTAVDLCVSCFSN